MRGGKGRKNKGNKSNFCLKRTFYEFLDVPCLMGTVNVAPLSQSGGRRPICAVAVMAGLNQMNGAAKAKHNVKCGFLLII